MSCGVVSFLPFSLSSPIKLLTRETPLKDVVGRDDGNNCEDTASPVVLGDEGL